MSPKRINIQWFWKFLGWMRFSIAWRFWKSNLIIVSNIKRNRLFLAILVRVYLVHVSVSTIVQLWCSSPQFDQFFFRIFLSVSHDSVWLVVERFAYLFWIWKFVVCNFKLKCGTHASLTWPFRSNIRLEFRNLKLWSCKAINYF